MELFQFSCWLPWVLYPGAFGNSWDLNPLSPPFWCIQMSTYHCVCYDLGYQCVCDDLGYQCVCDGPEWTLGCVFDDLVLIFLCVCNGSQGW